MRVDEIAPARQSNRVGEGTDRCEVAAPEDRVRDAGVSELPLERSAALRDHDERVELGGVELADQLHGETLSASGRERVEQHHDAGPAALHSATDLTAAITRSTWESVTAADIGMLKVRS